MRELRHFISVYKHINRVKRWQADFKSYKEALAYRDSLKDKEKFFYMRAG